MKWFRKAARPNQPGLIPSRTEPAAQRPLSIGPEELKGAALLAVELAAGGLAAGGATAVSLPSLDLRTTGGTLGIAPPPGKGNPADGKLPTLLK